MLPNINQLQAVVDALPAGEPDLRAAVRDLLIACAQQRAAVGRPFAGAALDTYLALKGAV